MSHAYDFLYISVQKVHRISTLARCRPCYRIDTSAQGPMDLTNGDVVQPRFSWDSALTAPVRPVLPRHLLEVHRLPARALAKYRVGCDGGVCNPSPSALPTPKRQITSDRPPNPHPLTLSLDPHLNPKVPSALTTHTARRSSLPLQAATGAGSTSSTAPGSLLTREGARDLPKRSKYTGGSARRSMRAR